MHAHCQHGDDQRIGHQITTLHDGIRLNTQCRPLSHGVAQHIACGDVQQAQVLAKQFGLGAFARSWRT